MIGKFDDKRTYRLWRLLPCYFSTSAPHRNKVAAHVFHHQEPSCLVDSGAASGTQQFSLMLLWQNYGQYQKAIHTRKLMEVAIATGNLIHTMQIERGRPPAFCNRMARTLLTNFQAFNKAPRPSCRLISM
jgi:hypothetical protein